MQHYLDQFGVSHLAFPVFTRKGEKIFPLRVALRRKGNEGSMTIQKNI